MIKSYALIQNNIVENIIIIDNENTEFIDSLKDKYQYVDEFTEKEVAIDWIYDAATDSYSPPPAPVDARPEVIITGVTGDVDKIDPNFTWVEMYEARAGKRTVATVTAELRKDGAILPITNSFNMPVTLKNPDGTPSNTDIFKANIVNGVMTLPVSFTNAGKWYCTEDGINSELPPENQFKFKGIVFIVARDV